jgi:hypothetical protein
MDDLDRLFQRLVHNIRNGHAEYLSVPFTVQELYDTLVPYRHYRRDLGIETNQDYEAAITRLLSGEKGYVRADQAMQDRLKQELESPHADVGAFRDYAETRISLAPDHCRKLGVAVPAQNAGGFSGGNGDAAAGIVRRSRNDGASRGMQILRRHFARGPDCHLLPALRTKPRREALRGMRQRAGSRLEILYQLRKADITAADCGSTALLTAD